MNIWKSVNWKKHADFSNRVGVRVRYEKNVDQEVKNEIKSLISWLNVRYEFPTRLNIYVKGSKKVRASDGDIVYDLFFWTFKHCDEPYITICTGDYCERKEKSGRNEALATILFALLTDMTHYFQWLNDKDFYSKYLKREARACARSILNDYSKTRCEL